jgi:hypothetical protein
VSLEAKLEQLRSLEVELMRAHIDEQEFHRSTFGARDFDPTEATMFSRAAAALGGLLDAIDDIVEESYSADEDAARTGEFGGNGMLTTDYVRETINGYLGDTA